MWLWKNSHKTTKSQAGKYGVDNNLSDSHATMLAIDSLVLHLRIGVQYHDII